jgi:hypothetical protein
MPFCEFDGIQSNAGATPRNRRKNEERPMKTDVLSRFAPLVLVLAMIAVVSHAGSASLDGGEPQAARATRTANVTLCASPAQAPSAATCEPKCAAPCLPTWCQPGAKLWRCCPDDYCRKPAPCVRCPDWRSVCPDYCRKCLPQAPCRVSGECDDYCRKSCPVRLASRICP